jgi:predicted CoA-binding protein
VAWLGSPQIVGLTVHTVLMDTGLDSGSIQGHRNDPAVVRRLLEHQGRWAVVGLSANPARVAYRIARYLQGLGMEIVPVHPRADTVHGAPGYRTLAEVPASPEYPIDVVDVFVRSDLAGDVVDQAIKVGAKAVWLQLGVIDEAAAARATAAGLDVVMDTCPAIEAPRLGIA